VSATHVWNNLNHVRLQPTYLKAK